MPDFNAITNAIVARFAPAQVTPPAGLDNIRLSTGALPEQMTPLPTVLVFPESGEFDHESAAGKRDSRHEYVIRFYFGQTGNLPRDTVALGKWLTVLVDQLKNSTQLGGIVTLALVSGWSMGVFAYAGSDYTGIELTLTIVTNEAWAAVA